jgi:hypothetical protein
MNHFYKNKRAVSNSILAVLILICVAIGLISFYLQSEINSLQTNNQNLQSKISDLQSSYSQLNNRYQDLLIAQDTATIKGVSIVNDNTILVSANSLSGKDISIIQAIVKDTSGNTKATDLGVSAILPANENPIKIILNLNNNLNSGNYTVTLYSRNGASFVSPVFTKP